MTKSFSNFSLLFVAIIVLAESCVSHDFPPYVCAPNVVVSYANDVHPIVTTKCAIEGCHNGDNGGDKNWTDFDLFQSKSKTARFYVIQRIMPPDGATPLTQDEINAIACWVDQDSPNN
jgi:hypothetical protein